MFPQEIRRGNIPQRSMTTDVIVVTDSSLDDTPDIIQALLFPNNRGILLLEMPVERFHVRVLPGSVQGI